MQSCMGIHFVDLVVDVTVGLKDDVNDSGCALATGAYYYNITGDCVYSCPVGFQGMLASGTCEECKLPIIIIELIQLLFKLLDV